MKCLTLIFVAILAIFTESNALQCSPTLCMIACPYGFSVDAQGCPRCSCRTTPEPCDSPLYEYNCGSIDNHQCPPSYQCQLSHGGYYGQCCLKTSYSTTSRTALATGTTPTGTTAQSTARRFFKRFTTDTMYLGTDSSSGTTQSSVTGTGSNAPAATTGSSSANTGATGSPATSAFGRRSAGTGSSSGTTQSSVTGTGSNAPAATTGSSSSNTGATGSPATFAFGRRSAGTGSSSGTTESSVTNDETAASNTVTSSWTTDDESDGSTKFMARSFGTAATGTTKMGVVSTTASYRASTTGRWWFF